MSMLMLRNIDDITARTMLPDLLRAFPRVRVVFNRYGLRGCGGQWGPVESIEFFARTHGVPQGKLLREIQHAARSDSPDQTSSASESSIADTIYRRFFTAGIVVILSLGATWGAWLLWRIGVSGKFTGVSIHEVNAHGHAQIFGWVGLFIIGFACQAFPRIWHVDLAAPKLAVVVFGLMISGVVTRSIGMALSGASAMALPLAIAGGVLELTAVAIFVGQVLTTFRRSRRSVEPYVGFVVAALLWFFAMAVMDVWHTYTTMTATDPKTLVWYISTYQAPLRDMQIHGLALFMILGVCIRMLPAMYGVPSASPRRLWLALGILSAAVAGECVVFVAYRWTGSHVLAALLMLPWLMLAAGVCMVALPWRLWRPFAQSDRSAKFIRTAYGWLAISLVMLLLLPVYQLISKIPFSHAYYGSIRHAITVGFISLMIMGFAGKVVPTLNGVNIQKLSPLWGPFILVNVGCFLRVSTQTLTDWHPGFFAVVGLSGTLEVVGLAWWGVGLIRIMRAGKHQLGEIVRATSRPERIRSDHLASDVFEWFPATAEVFDRFGFALLRRPLLRRTLGRTTTLSQAARMKGIDLDQFLTALNGAIGRSSEDNDRRRVSLTVLVS